MKDSVVRAFVRLGKFPLLPEAVYAAVAVMVFITVGFMSHWNGRDGGFGVGQPELVAMLSSGGQEVSQLLEDQAPPRNVLAFFPYIVVKGDTISEIAHRFGLNQGSIISCNAVEKARALQIGTVLQIPNMDGIMHTLKARDSLEKLAESYDVPPESILESNNISELSEAAGGKVFIPRRNCRPSSCDGSGANFSVTPPGDGSPPPTAGGPTPSAEKDASTTASISRGPTGRRSSPPWTAGSSKRATTIRRGITSFSAIWEATPPSTPI